MKNLFVFVVAFILLSGCERQKTAVPKDGIWRAALKITDGQTLPFNFAWTTSENGGYALQIFNGTETILVDEIEITNDSILIRAPVFEGYLAGTFTETAMQGAFIKESLDRVVPFTAVYGEPTRFDETKAHNTNVAGIWETLFSGDTEDEYLGKGIFSQKGNQVTGTFRTTTGDYRYLEGIVNGDSLKLSAFDGAHAFLFAARATDSTLEGTFFSGNHFQEPFLARRNPQFELPNADSLTFLKPGYDRFHFAFPDANGTIVSLDDDRFKGKVVLVQIMGTWCPNCLDETKFYVDYLKRNQEENLEIVGLAFEYAKTETGAFKSIERLKERIGVEYPIVLAQYGTSDKQKAQEKLPMLNHVLSYPTTILIDKKGEVRKIHTGFNGPATGEKHLEFKNTFEAFVQNLLNE
ncbi:peroxiredoxin family protein [Maribacter sp. 2-571]|uniref:peroxiredoxin family protein n=1 Tax=Maribacter sp. 2-571 TaxID=3417569 RepID=UPI003D345DB8